MSKGYVKIAAPVVPATPRPPELKLESNDVKHTESSPQMLSKSSLAVSRQRNGSHRKKSGKSGRSPSLPPMLGAVISCTHTFRFQCVTGFSALQNITGGNLAGAIGGYCTTANSTVKTIASSIRVRRIVVWPPQQSSPQNPPEITWFSPITVMEKDESKERMLPAGCTLSAPVVETPPANTICGDWFAVSSGASQPMFGLGNIASGAIIDVTLSWTITNNLLGSTPAIATGVLGTYYYLYLDGSTSHQLQPVGKPTTF